MEFSNRETQPHTPVAEAPVAHTNVVNKRRFSGTPDGMGRGIKLASVVLLFAITILLVAIAFLTYFSGNGEADYVQSKDFQAIDISSGGSNGSSDQIYFGNIKTMNDKYVVLDNVYYIPSTTSATTNITLQPLVCQVDVPFNQMIINRSSVNWWENLQGSGKVATAITNYQKNNPKGPSCPTTPTTTSPTTTTTTPTTTPTTTTTTPTTTTTKP